MQVQGRGTYVGLCYIDVVSENPKKGPIRLRQPWLNPTGNPLGGLCGFSHKCSALSSKSDKNQLQHSGISTSCLDRLVLAHPCFAPLCIPISVQPARCHLLCRLRLPVRFCCCPTVSFLPLGGVRGQVATQEEKDAMTDLVYQLEALNPTPDATNVNTIGEKKKKKLPLPCTLVLRARTGGNREGGGGLLKTRRLFILFCAINDIYVTLGNYIDPILAGGQRPFLQEATLVRS